MPKRRTVKKITASQLEFGDEFQMSGIVYQVLDAVVTDTVLVEFVPMNNPFAGANMMILQRDTSFLKFGPIRDEED